MSVTYNAELDELETTYKAGLGHDVEELRRALFSAASVPALFVGTGGTSAVARLAAQFHEQVCAQPARAATPLELLMAPQMPRRAAVLFSASAKHPDARAVLDRLSAGWFHPAVVVTHRDPDELAAGPDVAVVRLPELLFRDGFLATNSVLAMVVALSRAYLGSSALASSIPRPDVPFPSRGRTRLLVLTTPELEPVAADIETRCAELGVADVQVSDYRNFAHGRHMGLARRATETTVIGLSSEPLQDLAEATLSVLLAEGSVEVLHWAARHSSPTGVVELFLASMQLARRLAAEQGVRPSRPGVPSFGRRLYHLPLRGMLPRPADGPVERKLWALGAGTVEEDIRELYERAYADWRVGLGEQRFSGVVLDYDGTVCATRRRFDLPDERLRALVVKLLDAELVFGFASGRGRSLHRDLRKWVPREYWSQVHLGLYNGAIRLTLADKLPAVDRPNSLMRAVTERIMLLPIADMLVIEPRQAQVTVSLRGDAFAHSGKLAELVSDVLARPEQLQVKVVASGHSVDVVKSDTSKVAVWEEVAALGDSPLLAIGDQGHLGGNDFELLARSPWSLTVDRCSADPSRCWYLDVGGRSGPLLLDAYLRSLVASKSGFKLDWKDA